MAQQAAWSTRGERVPGKEERGTVGCCCDFKRAVRLAHGHRYAKDVKIGHLPCVYIRVDCRGGKGGSSKGGRGGGVSLHELCPVGIPATCVGLYMGPCMEDLTYRSTERLLFGPSLSTSLPPVCPAAAVDRLVLPPSHLQPAADCHRCDGGNTRNHGAFNLEAAGGIYVGGYGYIGNGFERRGRGAGSPAASSGGVVGGNGDGYDGFAEGGRGTGARTGPNRGVGVGLRPTRSRGTYGGSYGGNFGGTNVGNARSNYRRTNGGNTRGNYGSTKGRLVR
eukprot:jgi/Undpi1/6924/HiC_scaffold_21.g09398.m1